MPIYAYQTATAYQGYPDVQHATVPGFSPSSYHPPQWLGLPGQPPRATPTHYAVPVAHPAIRAATPQDIKKLHELYASGKAITDAADDGQRDGNIMKAISAFKAASKLDQDIGPTDLHDPIQTGWAHALSLADQTKNPVQSDFHLLPRCSEGGTSFFLGCSE